MGLTFLGRWDCKVDGKRRITVPADLRDELDEIGKQQLVVTLGEGGGLVVMPQQLWDEFTRELLQDASRGDKDAIGLRGTLARYGSRGKLDASGRLNLTEEQLAISGITKQAIVFGNVKRIEIWEPKQFELNNPPIDDMAEHEAVMAKYMGQAETRG